MKNRVSVWVETSAMFVDIMSNFSATSRFHQGEFVFVFVCLVFYYFYVLIIFILFMLHLHFLFLIIILFYLCYIIILYVLNSNSLLDSTLHIIIGILLVLDRFNDTLRQYGGPKTSSLSIKYFTSYSEFKTRGHVTNFFV